MWLCAVVLAVIPSQNIITNIVAVAGSGIPECKLGADTTAIDLTGWTSLHLCTMRGDHVVSEHLLQRGAQINARDEWRHTPLHWAAYRGRIEVVKVLLQHGALVNLQDIAGQTPLHWVSYAGHFEIAQLLLKEGASLDTVDKNMMTALHVAVLSGNYWGKSCTKDEARLHYYCPRDIPFLLAASGADMTIVATAGACGGFNAIACSRLYFSGETPTSEALLCNLHNVSRPHTNFCVDMSTANCTAVACPVAAAGTTADNMEY